MTPDQYYHCIKKVKYGHIESAQKAVEEMKKKAKNVLEAYKCNYCDGFHIGRIRTGQLKQFRLDFFEE